MHKTSSVVTEVLSCIQEKYSKMGAGFLCLDGAYPQISNPNNNIDRALSLIKSFGNVVFISELTGQGQRLATEVLRLGNYVPGQKVLQLDIGVLISTNREPAESNFEDILHQLYKAKGKIGLVITALEGIMENAGIFSIFCKAIEQKSIPIIGVTNMEGFRKLERKPELSGSLQFILTEKERISTKRKNCVLIVGATSLFGNAVYRLFIQEYEDVKGTGFSKASSLGFDKLDVTSEEEIKKYLTKHSKFDIIIYVAGEADADVAEKQRDRARLLNTGVVSIIARYTKNCKFVYISSEYVFDGKSGPYGAGSCANPINYYGRTKLEGEKASLENFSNALVLRLGALYGYNGPDDKKTTVSKLIASLDKLEPLAVDNVQIKHPILLEDAAKTLLKLLDYGATGIYQTNGPQGLNKQEMAEQIIAVRKTLTGHIFSYPVIGTEQTGVAGKPINTHMVNVDTPRPFDEGIRFLLTRLEAFKENKNHGHQ